MKYVVWCTKVYNGFVEVEAEDKDEAVDIAQMKIINEEVSWEFGEATADFADELEY